MRQPVTADNLQVFMKALAAAVTYTKPHLSGWRRYLSLARLANIHYRYRSEDHS